MDTLILTKLEARLHNHGLRLPDFVREQANTCRYKKDSLICITGEKVDKIQILIQGELIILNSFSNGKEFAFTNENSFTVLGDFEFFSRQMVNASTVISKTGVTLVELGVRTFEAWINADRKFYDFMVWQIACKCYKNAKIQGDIKYTSSSAKVLGKLIEVSTPSDDAEDILVAEYSHYEIARMSGISERTVNRVLQNLQKKGILSIQYRKILIRKNCIHFLDEDI